MEDLTRLGDRMPDAKTIWLVCEELARETGESPVQIV